jgi:hypothetical protein
MEKATREEKKKRCRDTKALTPINDMLGHKYLQYKRSRSRMAEYAPAKASDEEHG